MTIRRLALVAATLPLLASAACIPAAERARRQAAVDAAVATVPANAPAGVFATGYWDGGSMRGETPARFAYASRVATATVPMLGIEQTREFAVESYAWRDSARVAFVYENQTLGRSIVRQFPRSLSVVGDTMTFAMPYLFAWKDVDCRLVAHGSAWRGTCRTPQDDRVATIELPLPRFASR